MRQKGLLQRHRQPATGRRDFLRGVSALVATVSGIGVLPQAAGSAELRNETAPSFIANDTAAVVETTNGKVKGYIRNGIRTFKGMPYGSVAGERDRFMPPSRPTPWAGVRSSLYYGPVCPQVVSPWWENDEQGFFNDWDEGHPAEDCLRVNVWTPGLDNRKRPVMFWIHGGGFTTGSSQQLRAYEGENLAKRGDVVVVSVNHRLNALGFLNLAEYGSKWESSANVGMLDLAAALEWVRDNVANFGGNPANVMIFGQSGGGSKVGVLMAMPAAKGLFHRASVQSGSGLRQATPDQTAKLAAAVLAELGISKSQVDQIQKVPVDKLIAAARQVAPGAGPGGWGPTVDGKILPNHPFDPTAPLLSANVPMIIGTVLNEMTTALGHPEYEAMAVDQVKARLKKSYADQGERVYDAYRKAYPNAKPFDVLSIALAAPSRQSAITQAERKVALKAAPAYLYWFKWQTPDLEGRARAKHNAELPFVFDNIDRCEPMTGNSPQAHQLAARVSEAWINFARKGDPNHTGLPKWTPFNKDTVPTMIFDNKCELLNNPDGEERKSIQA